MFFHHFLFVICVGSSNDKSKKKNERTKGKKHHITTKGSENVITKVNRPRKIDLFESIASDYTRNTYRAKHTDTFAVVIPIEMRLARKIQVSFFRTFCLYIFGIVKRAV